MSETNQQNRSSVFYGTNHPDHVQGSRTVTFVDFPHSGDFRMERREGTSSSGGLDRQKVLPERRGRFRKMKRIVQLFDVGYLGFCVCLFLVIAVVEISKRI